MDARVGVGFCARIDANSELRPDIVKARSLATMDIDVIGSSVAMKLAGVAEILSRQMVKKFSTYNVRATAGLASREDALCPTLALSQALSTSIKSAIATVDMSDPRKQKW
ncbi:hypothetical protein SUNI508_04152 [Seiridium unicorne]|uniref:Uncharacterized protein n=1 Tax=Seiridium unicorne TaxID=138068 RepID=A0ABR2V8M0_9PEZI